MARKLWVDKYRPLDIESLDYHEHISSFLHRLATAEDLPHLLFYGPNGAGKKTRALALLQSIFGPGVQKLKSETRTFKVNTVSVELHVLQSNFHIDMTPSDIAHRDKIAVQQIIKEIGSNKNPDGRAFKVIILNQADNLSGEAQAALRRTMEKYTQTTRIIMICNSLCRIIAPLRSRCLAIRVPAPTPTDIVKVLRKTVAGERLELPDLLADMIVKEVNGNMRRAIMILQTIVIQHGRIANNLEIPVPEWQKYVREIVHNAISDQTPKNLKLIRTKVFDLLGSCIPPSNIVLEICEVMLENVHPGIKTEIVRNAAEYELLMKHGTKPVIHIEAFIAKCMFLIKQNASMMHYG